jgi:hypothetical protein
VNRKLPPVVRPRNIPPPKSLAHDLGKGGKEWKKELKTKVKDHIFPT